MAIGGAVNAVAPAPNGGSFVGGSFNAPQAATGSGVIVPAAGDGAPVPSNYPKVTGGGVRAVVADGSGGWFVGGDFTTVGGEERTGLAHIRTDGSVDPAWNPAPDGYVATLAVSGTTLYVGGTFNQIGEAPRRYLAAISTSTGQATSWSPAPGDQVAVLASSGTTLYVGGSFSTIGGAGRSGLAAVSLSTGNVTSWNPSSGSGSIDRLALNGPTLYLAGAFDEIAGQPRTNLAAVSATTGAATGWNPAPAESDSAFEGINALAVSGSTVFVGGIFDRVGGQERENVAALDATTGNATSWHADVTSADTSFDAVHTLSVLGTTLYIGGEFDHVSGQDRANAAAVDTATAAVQSWNPSPNSAAEATAASGSKVYVGGTFTGAGAPLATVRRLAHVEADGAFDTDWKPAVSGRAVEKLARVGSTLYLGGTFDAVNGQARGNLAAIDVTNASTTAWNPNANGSVSALTPAGSTIYVAGDFTSVGSQARSGLAALDATSAAATGWNPSPDGSVAALTVVGSTVYAGGYFEYIGGQARRNLAALDATTGTATAWNPSPDEYVRALAPTGATLYVGGSFSNVGGQQREGLAAISTATGNATAWNPAKYESGSGLGGTVEAMTVVGPKLYLGGSFNVIAGQLRGGLAAVDTATGALESWDPAPDGTVRALAASGSQVVAGGSFTRITDAPEWTGRVAILDGVHGAGSTDTTAPAIQITRPTSGQVFTVGQQIQPEFTCTDGPEGSGVATCTASGPIDTSSAGSRTFSVTTRDHAGNEASSSVTYVVEDPPATGGGTTTTTTTPPPTPTTPTTPTRPPSTTPTPTTPAPPAATPKTPKITAPTQLTRSQVAKDLFQKEGVGWRTPNPLPWGRGSMSMTSSGSRSSR